MDFIVKVERFRKVLRERLAAQLAAEEITQEEYDERAGMDGLWVLAVDPVKERFLLIHKKEFEWVPMAECTLNGAALPREPRAVFVIPPPQSSGLVQARGSGSMPPGAVN